MSELDAMVAVATTAARRAGAIQKEKFGGILNVDAKLADDVKLEADRLCEAAIVEAIRERFPGHAILAEEGGKSDGAKYIWYVDPLDGTVNFYYGLPYFCTTLACYRQTAASASDPAGMGEPLAAVTYAPLTGDLFFATKGGGAFLNERRVTVREEESLADALIITTIGNNPRKVAYTRDVILELSLHIRKTRNMGACALDLAMVAAGRASGFIEFGVNPWDIAAGRLLVEEAGGSVAVRPVGGGKLVIAASGRNIHGHLLEAIDKGVAGD